MNMNKIGEWVVNVQRAFVAIALICASGCASVPEEHRIPESTWRTFEENGHKDNRLELDNKMPLSAEARATLGSVAVVATNEGPRLDAQRPLTRGKAAWRGAKLWVGWEQSRPARRLDRGRYQCGHDRQPDDAPFAGLSGEGAAAVAMGYILYIPVGLTVGAISGAVSVPSEKQVEQALGVLSNRLGQVEAQHLLGDYLLRELQRSERGLLAEPQLIAREEQPGGVNSLEIRFQSVILEGGVKPNPKLWLTLGWSAQLRPANSVEIAYSNGGVWQSHEKRTLQKWAVDDGRALEDSLKEACRQISAVLAEQIAGLN